jgi:aspartyl-tRNA(Asn)/glutamyl-tRNA(Gln) amidotransferase subunit C
MPITEADIQNIAALAHLEITDEELHTLAPQVAAIVTYVEQLSGLDTSQVEPAFGGLTPEGEETVATREDSTRPSLGQALALEQAPEPSHGHFRVPKVIASSEEKENF